MQNLVDRLKSDIWNTPSPDPDYERNQAARMAIFRKIAPRSNWKDPIDAWIPMTDFSACNQAAIFFTGSPLLTVARRGNDIRVRAPGYYRTIGA